MPKDKQWGMPPEPKPEEERDIDQWAEDRETKGENRQHGYKKLPGRPPKGVDKHWIKNSIAPKTWMESLMEQGFVSPIIKQVTPDGRQMWFLQDGIDYIANLGMMGNVFVEKAVFKPTLRQPSVSYAPSQTNRKHKERKSRQGEPYMGDTIDDDEASMGT